MVSAAIQHAEAPSGLQTFTSDGDRSRLTSAVVKAVRAGSVAGRSGVLRPGQRLVAVNGTSVEGLEYLDIIDRVKSTRPITLTLQAPG